MTALYTTDDGQPITTHSMVKSFRRCPKQAEYKYVERLKPRAVGRPLKRGTWVHKLLETFYLGKSWKREHKKLEKSLAQLDLFDEEIEDLYDTLADDCHRMMEAYLWHYEADDFEVHDVEVTLEAELPDGTLYRCRVDLLGEDEYGLFLMDHKSKKQRHTQDELILDSQSVPYIWAARENDIDVARFVWNYLPDKPPTVPEITKKGNVSRRQVNTDLPTLMSVIEESEEEPEDLAEWIEVLERQRYTPGGPQLSPFFQRVAIERDDDMLDRSMHELLRSSSRMHEYYGEDDAVERVPDISCKWCDFRALCVADLFGNNTSQIRRAHFEQGDPLDYYHDDPDTTEEPI